MQKKLPNARTLANTSAKLAIEYRGKYGPRLFEVSPAMAGTVVAGLAFISTMALAASVYVFSKDEILRATLSSQARMQYAYEDRITQLRAHIDRVAGRQLVDQDSVEAKLHELINRQVQLESRQALVNRMAEEAARSGMVVAESRPLARPDMTPTGSINAFMPMRAPTPAPDAPRAKPMPEEPGLRSSSGQVAPLRLPDAPQRSSSLPLHRTLPALLDHAQTSSQIMSNNQLAVLRSIELNAQSTSRKLRTALTSTGLDLARFGKALAARPATLPAATSDVGGPLIPLTKSDKSEFEQRLSQAEATLQENLRLTRVARALPIHRPLPRGYETTSPFGARSDPFTKGPAMHAGQDFRAPTGTPVRVTADGRVIEAGWVGGYGKLVEIDHGFGLTTRYGHLSSIDVAIGDTVKKGDAVGLVGSTGRSTGPHLHYEVRIDDEASDPMTFLRAGERVFNN